MINIIQPNNEIPCLAIAVPCFNEEGLISKTSIVLNKVLDDLVSRNLVLKHSFIFFIDDGSSDHSWEKIKSLNHSSGRIKGARLSKNFGHQAALFAGYSCLVDQSDVVISIDADLQQDPNSIPLFIEKYAEGFDVVLGIRRDRNADGVFKKLTAQFFYKLASFMGVEIIPNHADYRLLSKRALSSLLLFQEPGIFLRALCLQLGFPTAVVQFDVCERLEGNSKYTFKKMVRLSLDGITSFSVVPLRLVFAIGLIVFLLSLIMSAYVLWTFMVNDYVIPGWASTILPIYLIGGIQLLCLGVIGEYLGNIFKVVRNRPRWIFESILK